MAIDNQKTQIIIEDHVVPQLLTSAIEAYQHGDVTTIGTRLRNKLETYGLLWGYTLPARDGVPARIVAVTSTIEISADRQRDSVDPIRESLKQKREFFETYWPNLELVGTFHSHPYKDHNEIKKCQGWRASGEDGDLGHWREIHELICPEYSHLAHLIVSVVCLDRKSTKWPERLSNNEAPTGYKFGAGNYRIWVKGYSTEHMELFDYIHEDEDGDAKVDDGCNEKVEEFDCFSVSEQGYVLDTDDNILSYSDVKDDKHFYVNEDVELHIPSLENRFSAHVNSRF